MFACICAPLLLHWLCVASFISISNNCNNVLNCKAVAACRNPWSRVGPPSSGYEVGMQSQVGLVSVPFVLSFEVVVSLGLIECSLGCVHEVRVRISRSRQVRLWLQSFWVGKWREISMLVVTTTEDCGVTACGLEMVTCSLYSQLHILPHVVS